MEENNNEESNVNEEKDVISEKTQNNRNRLFTIIVVILLIIVLVLFYFVYKGQYRITESKNSGEEYDSEDYLDDEEYNADEWFDEEWNSDEETEIYSNEDLDVESEEDDQSYEEWFDSTWNDDDYDESEEDLANDAEYEALVNQYKTYINNLSMQQVYTTKDNQICYSATNNNDTFLSDVDVYVVFYSANKIVGIENDFISFISPHEVQYLYTYFEEAYDRVEFYVDKSMYDDSCYTDLSSTLKLETKENSDYYMAAGENTTGKDISEVSYNILYKNAAGKIIYVDTIYEFDVSANDKVRLLGYVSTNDDYDFLEEPIASHEVVFGHAYSYECEEYEY